MRRKLQVAVLAFAALWAVGGPTAEAALWSFWPLSTLPYPAKLGAAAAKINSFSTNPLLSAFSFLWGPLGAFLGPPAPPP